MMKGALKLFVVILLSLSLFACGGGGGGGGVVAPTATLSGTVTDSTLEPVAGVSVAVQGGSTTQTDAAGRYTLRGISAIAHQISFAPSTNNYFPAAATVVFVGGKTTVLDIFLARANGQTLPAAEAGGTITSDTYINAVQDSTFDLKLGDVEDSTGADYIGNATVYVAPIDVGKPGHGLASYQSNLGNVFTALTGSPSSTSTIEIFGAAAVAIEDDGVPANTLALSTGSTSTLELPIPASPVELRENAPLNVNADLWYYDESVGALVKHTTQATYNTGTVSGPYFVATIDRTGLWLAGVEHLTPTIITGTLLFSDFTVAAGATIYAAGDDHGFTHITSTDASGSFSFPVKTGSDLTLHFVVSANGAQWPHEVSLVGLAANAAMGNIVLPFAPPVSGAAAQATITVDDRDIAGGGNAPDVLGYVLSSGRQLSEPDSADDSTARNIGNVVFVASSLADFDPITVDPSLNGSGIQVVAGTFETLSTVPTAGYTAAKVNLDPVVITFPVLLALQTDKGHYGKISIDSVESLNPPNNNEWRITFRHAFSLTNTF